VCKVAGSRVAEIQRSKTTSVNLSTVVATADSSLNDSINIRSSQFLRSGRDISGVQAISLPPSILFPSLFVDSAAGQFTCVVEVIRRGVVV